MAYLRPGWRFLVWRARRESCAFAAASVLVIAGVATGLYLQHQTIGAVTTESAVVVGFGAYADVTGGLPVVMVRTRQGQTRQLRLPSLNAADHCLKGSTIRLIRKGSGLFVHPEGCARPERPAKGGVA